MWSPYVITCSTNVSSIVTCSYTLNGNPGTLPLTVKSAVKGIIAFPSFNEQNLQVTINCTQSSFLVKDNDNSEFIPDFILAPNQILRELVSPNIIRSRTFVLVNQ